MPTQKDLNEPIPTGSLASGKMDEEKYYRMLNEYYDLCGWDREISIPTGKALIDLGLEYIAKDLEKMRNLR